MRTIKFLVEKKGSLNDDVLLDLEKVSFSNPIPIKLNYSEIISTGELEVTEEGIFCTCTIPDDERFLSLYPALSGRINLERGIQTISSVSLNSSKNIDEGIKNIKEQCFSWKTENKLMEGIMTAHKAIENYKDDMLLNGLDITFRDKKSATELFRKENRRSQFNFLFACSHKNMETRTLLGFISSELKIDFEVLKRLWEQFHREVK